MNHNKLTYKIKPIHPFAARMAPEIAFEALKGLKKTSTILDPMVGSGTVLRTVSEQGYNGIGFDIDPLAILMSSVWTTTFNSDKIKLIAKQIIDEVNGLDLNSIYLPWIDDDPKTISFINFWFGSKQINSLRKLSFVINNHKDIYSDLFKVAFSRLIITKTKGASLAADVSHSRPHKVYDENDFDVFTAFSNSCNTLSKIFEKQKPKGKVIVQLGDARNLSEVNDSSIAAIITSPPYLNALDYMRGHKLSLVWLGYRIDELGSVRSNSVGVEKAPDSFANIALASEITKGIHSLKLLPQRKQNMIYRYALDIYQILQESARVLEKNGKATFVVGNSCMNEIFVENTLIVRNSCQMVGLKLTNQKEREIPQNKRYLPPPSFENISSFKSRMRTEAVMSFTKQ
jgi:tRNA G10  N-methylase Trm11